MSIRFIKGKEIQYWAIRWGILGAQIWILWCNFMPGRNPFFMHKRTTDFTYWWGIWGFRLVYFPRRYFSSKPCPQSTSAPAA
jgi:hypothetical protein